MEKLPLMSVIVPSPDLPFTLTLTPMRGSPDASFTVPFTRVFFVCEVLNMLACPALMSGARINKEAIARLKNKSLYFLQVIPCFDLRN